MTIERGTPNRENGTNHKEIRKDSHYEFFFSLCIVCGSEPLN